MGRLLISGLLGLGISCGVEIDPVSTSMTRVRGVLENGQTRSVKLVKDSEVFPAIFRGDTFIIELPIEKPAYYELQLNANQISLYLLPKDDLLMLVDPRSPKHQIKFYGNSSESNNYIALFRAFIEDNLPDERLLYGLPERDFYEKVSSFRDQGLAFLTDFITNRHNLNPHFFEQERARIWYIWGLHLNKYPTVRSYLLEKQSEPVLSPSYYSYQRELSLNESGLIDIPEYLEYVESCLLLEARSIGRDRSDIDVHEVAFDLISKRISADEVRNYCYYRIMRKILRSNKIETCDELIRKYKYRNTNSTLRRDLVDQYYRLKLVQPGNAAPGFKLIDLDNQLVDSDKFLGRMVYAILWSSDCKGCLPELQHLQKLALEFENTPIHFISISLHDLSDLWRSSLPGDDGPCNHYRIHPDFRAEFYKDYLVEGIPRAILIGLNGEIIDAFAKRSGSTALRRQLEKIFVKQDTKQKLSYF